MNNRSPYRFRRAAARVLSVMLAAVMICAAAAPSVSAAAADMQAVPDSVRYSGLTPNEIALVESGIKIQIRNLTGTEKDAYILRFGNNNIYRADGTHDSSKPLGDDKYPVIGKVLDSNGYPVIESDPIRGMTKAQFTTAYGSNTIKELFEGKKADGTYFSSDTAPGGPNALYTASNNMFKYNSETGYYTYDSKYNHAYFDTTTGKFTLYDSPLRPGAITASYGYQTFGAFLPFNDCVTDVVKISDANGVVDTSVITEGEENSDKIQYASTNTSCYKNLHAIKNNSTQNLADNWFVMSVDFSFFVPAGGQYNGSDMIFHFSGDDDVWVYLDGVLVVDQGGTHRHTASDINFATGEVYYQHYTYADANDIPDGVELVNDPENYPVEGSWSWYKTSIKQRFTEAGVADQYTFDNTSDSFADYTEHRLQFFFLERGGEASNCELGFNLPVLPDGALSVQKSVTTDYLTENAKDALYTFVLQDDEGAAIADASYSVMMPDGTLVSDKNTDAEGKFRLKANERAIFDAVDPNEKYAVVQLTELADSVYDTYAESTDVSLDGTKIENSTDEDGNATTGEFLIYYDQSYLVDFNNTLKTIDFTVEKQVGEYVDPDQEFEFTVEAEGMADTNFTLTGGDTKTISVPVGADVSVTENNLPAGFIVSNKLSTANSYTDGNAYSVDNLTAAQTVEYFNELETNELTITKTTTGSLGDRAKQFTFTLDVTAANGETVSFPESAEYTYDRETGKVTFTLANGESLTLPGIPYGADFSVSENADGYIAKVAEGSAAQTESESFAKSGMTEDVTVNYTNSLDGAPDTGVFLDSLPYILLLAIAGAGAAVIVMRRRSLTEID